MGRQVSEVCSVLWRRRRGRARSVAPRSAGSAGRGQWANAPVEAGARTGDHGADRRSDAAWQMDQPRQPQVAWSAQADATRPYARTDTHSVGAARPTVGRLGTSMPSIYCPGCGEANPENARFCSQCGTPLTRAAAERATAGETTSMIFSGAELTE